MAHPELGPTATGRSRSIRSNAIWTFSANAIFQGTRWLIIVALVKWGSAELVGQYVLGVAITQSIFMLANMDLSSAQATDARRDYTFREYAALRSLTIPLAVAATAGLLFFLDLGAETSLVVMLVAATRVVASVDLLFFGVFSQHERLDKAGVSLILRGVLSLGAFVGLFLWTDSLPWALVGISGAWLVVVVGYSVPQSRPLIRSDTTEADRVPLRAIWSGRRLRKLAWLVFPLGLAALLSSLTYNIPRYVVQALLGSGQLGVFGAVAYVVQLVQLFAKAFRHATAPRLAKYYAANRLDAFVRLMSQVLIAFAALSALGVVTALVWGEQILLLLYGPEYVEPAVFAIAIGASGLLMIVTLMTTGVLATRRFGPVLLTRATGTAVALGSGLVLVPAADLHGAAWSLVIAYASSALVAGWFLRSAIVKPQTDAQPTEPAIKPDGRKVTKRAGRRQPSSYQPREDVGL